VKPVKHSVAVVVRDEGGRFLVVKRPDDPEDPLACVWGFPAITLHDNEPERPGVLRAGPAKLGVALAAGRKIGETTADRGGYLLHLSDYEAMIVSGTPSVPQADTSMTQYVDWRFTDDPAILDEAAAKGSLCAQIFLANWVDPLPGPGTQAKTALFDHQAAVLHVEEPGVFGDRAGQGRRDAELQPQGGGAGGDRLPGDVRRLPRRPEHVDKPHLLRYLSERPVDPFAEDLVGVRVHGHDPPAKPLHVGRHGVSCLVGSGARADHGDRVVARQDAFDDRVSIRHASGNHADTSSMPGPLATMRPRGHNASMPEVSEAYMEAMRHGFEFARAMGRRQCRPVDVLVGVDEADASLFPGPGQSLREVAARMFAGGDGAGYLHMQAQEAAQDLAGRLNQRPAPAHLLVALIDQGDPEVVAVLEASGRDPRAVRAHAAAAMGVEGNLPAVRMPPMVPAGTLDRPPLPPEAVDARALAAVRRRAEHLPLHMVRGARDRAALAELEAGEVLRIVRRLGLDDDQAYTLLSLHRAEVDQRTGATRPEGPRPRPRLPPRPGLGRAARLTVGWGVWLGNRRAGLHRRWFRLRAARYYRESPL
jgi:8-oxo-dGTP diphosphatase